MSYNAIILYGFAIFAMFFGSGNLVFPISIGFNSGINWFFGFIGLLLTGVVLPFLGLFVIKLHKGSYYNFFGEAGKIAKFVVPCFTLSLLGSFGVVPRCITVAHGGLGYIFPNISLFNFAAIFCVISFICCLKDQTMIKALGKWMSPVLLVILMVLIIFGIVEADKPTLLIKKNEAFANGFFTGYQTMDLFAAFFFSTLIFKQIQEFLPSSASDEQVIKFAIKSSVIGSVLLAFVYLGFVFLGSHYAGLISDTLPEHMLPKIVSYAMGDVAVLMLAIAMIISCLTTAMALNSIYARYLTDLFRCDDNKFPVMLLFTTVISFGISLLDFRLIASFLAPVLEVSYPGVILLTLMSICSKHYQKLKTYVFWLVTLCALIWKVIT